MHRVSVNHRIEMPTEKPSPRRGRPTRLSAEAAGNSTALAGLELLKVIAQADDRMNLTEIAKASQMSASRTHRYLSSLQKSGFLEKDEATGRFEMGIATMEIGFAAMRRYDSSAATADILEALTKATGLCAYLCIWTSNGPTVIRNEMGDVQTVARMRLGTNLSLLTATGQVFLAHMPEQATREQLELDVKEWRRETKDAKISAAESRKSAQKVLRNGIARTRGMRNPNWTAFSCPVFDENRKFQMAVTVIGVNSMTDAKNEGTVAKALKQAAQRLSGVPRL
jgi:DNA-binding IclR family transcriptional regulator